MINEIYSLQDNNNTAIEKVSTIKKLENKVKNIPVSKTEENLRIYNKLLLLAPSNQKYKNKVIFYESRQLEEKNTFKKLKEIKSFTEKDFYFDKNTMPYKDIIINGVNKTHRENSRCKDIDPSSAYISSSKGTKGNPVFFVTCGKQYDVFNVFFSKSDIENDKKILASKHISKTKAVDICERYATSSAIHPSTVDFSTFMDLSIYETPNGRTRLSSSFTAKNSFNLLIKFNIICLLNSNGLIEANINESE